MCGSLSLKMFKLYETLKLREWFIFKRDKAIDKVENNTIESPYEAFKFAKDLNISLFWHCCAYMCGESWNG